MTEDRATKCKCRYRDGLSPLSRISLSYINDSDPYGFRPALGCLDSLKGESFDAEFKEGKWHVVIGPAAFSCEETYDELSFRECFEVVAK